VGNIFNDAGERRDRRVPTGGFGWIVCCLKAVRSCVRCPMTCCGGPCQERGKEAARARPRLHVGQVRRSRRAADGIASSRRCTSTTRRRVETTSRAAGRSDRRYRVRSPQARTRAGKCLPRVAEYFHGTYRSTGLLERTTERRDACTSLAWCSRSQGIDRRLDCPLTRPRTADAGFV